MSAREHERLLTGVTAVAVFLLIWEGLSRGWWAAALRPLLGAEAAVFAVKPIFISSPSAVLASAWTMAFVTGELWPHVAESAMEVAVGLAAAIAVGVPLGLVTGRNRLLSYAFSPFVAALNATPQVAFLPLIVMWVGTGFATRALIVFLLCVIPLFIHAHAAVRTVDARLLKVARSFSSPELRTFTSIILPSSVPFLLAGLRLAIGRAMIGVIVGELYGSATGIGIMINRAGSTFDTDKVFVGVLVIVAAGVTLSEVLLRLERRIEGWRAPIAEGA